MRRLPELPEVACIISQNDQKKCSGQKPEKYYHFRRIGQLLHEKSIGAPNQAGSKNLKICLQIIQPLFKLYTGQYRRFWTLLPVFLSAELSLHGAGY